MASNIIELCSILCIRFGRSLPILYFGRMMAGYALGLCNGNIPPYTSEICQPRIRMFTGAFFILADYGGFAITYVLDDLMPWKDALLVIAALPCINTFLLFFCPESPTWLLVNGGKNNAIATMKALRGNSEVAMQEIDRMDNNLRKQNQGRAQTNGYTSSRKSKRIFQGPFVRPCAVLVILMAIGWIWSGGVVFAHYAVEILNEFEVPLNTYWTGACITSYQIFVGLVGSIISSVCPRRKYYICSGLLMSTGLSMLGTYSYLTQYISFTEFVDRHEGTKWIPLLAFLLFCSGYNSGYIPVSFMFLAELLPSNARNIGITIAMTCSYISGFMALKFAPYIEETLGLYGLIWIFAVVDLGAIIFVYFCVPETFGKSLEEIEDHYRLLCYGNRNTNSSDGV